MGQILADDFILVLSPVAPGLSGVSSSTAPPEVNSRILRRPLPAGGGIFIRR